MTLVILLVKYVSTIFICVQSQETSHYAFMKMCTSFKTPLLSVVCVQELYIAVNIIYRIAGMNDLHATLHYPKKDYCTKTSVCTDIIY